MQIDDFWRLDENEQVKGRVVVERLIERVRHEDGVQLALRDLGDLVRQRRKAYGLQREEIAQAIGLPASWLLFLENGIVWQDEIQAECLDRLAAYLELNVSLLRALWQSRSV